MLQPHNRLSPSSQESPSKADEHAPGGGSPREPAQPQSDCGTGAESKRGLGRSRVGGFLIGFEEVARAAWEGASLIATARTHVAIIEASSSARFRRRRQSMTPRARRCRRSRFSDRPQTTSCSICSYVSRTYRSSRRSSPSSQPLTAGRCCLRRGGRRGRPFRSSHARRPRPSGSTCPTRSERASSGFRG